jgi:hypothetical protein
METDKTESEIDERVPCEDELCTGVLDAAGVCGTCSKQGSREAGAALRTPATTPEHDVEEANASESDSEGEGDESDRLPCTDDMCTGLIGADGRCGTCGRTGD